MHTVSIALFGAKASVCGGEAVSSDPSVPSGKHWPKVYLASHATRVVALPLRILDRSRPYVPGVTRWAPKPSGGLVLSRCGSSDEPSWASAYAAPNNRNQIECCFARRLEEKSYCVGPPDVAPLTTAAVRTAYIVVPGDIEWTLGLTVGGAPRIVT